MPNAKLRYPVVVGLIAALLLINFPKISFAAVILPNDPLFSEQWHLNRIQAVGAWEKTTGSKEVVVAVLDTGVDVDHPDLATNIWHNSNEYINGKDDDGNGFIDDLEGWDFVDNDNEPRPDVSSNSITRSGVNHGTIIAGLIGANTGNSLGVAGINWKARLMPVRVLDSQGIGDTLAVEKGIRYAISNGADVINLSFVGKTFSPSLYNAVLDAWRNNIVVVSAVGNITASDNNLDSAPLYPACFNGPAGENIVLAVAGVDREDKLARSSNFGNCVDIVAPSAGIVSTQNFDEGNSLFRQPYGGGWSGTSVAAALVSGVAALIKSFNRDLRASEIIQLITDNSESVEQLNPGKDGALGRGRLNAFLALQAAEDYLRGQGRSFVKKGEIIVATDFYSGQPVRIFDGNSWVGNITPYENNFYGGIALSSGDVNGDSFRELATIPRSGGGPHVRIWRSDGKLADEFFAYEKDFAGGVDVAFANLDGSGSEQIITVPASGKEAEVRIWKRNGTLFNKFLAFPENYTGGARIAAADFDRDGQDEIIVVPTGAFEPVVKIFRPDGILISSFLAYDKRYRGGLNLTLGDLNGDGWTEILTIPRQASPRIRVWNYLGKELRPGFYLTSKLERNIKITSGDTNGDGKAEIVLGVNRGGLPKIRVYDSNLKLKKEILAYPTKERGGVNVAVVK